MPEYLTAAAAAKKYPAWWANILKAVGQLVIIAEPPVVTPPVVTPPTGVSVFRTPVAGLTPGDPRYIRNLVEYGDTFASEGKRWTLETGMGDKGDDYAVPIYDAREKTMDVKVRRKANFPGIWNLAPDDTIPFNPAWRPADGKDAYMIVRDPDTGHSWALWNASWWSYETDVNNRWPAVLNPANLAPPFGVGYDPATMVAAASAFQIRDPQGHPVDTRTWRGNFPGACGGGWPLDPLLVTPDEILSGRIDHALHFVSANTMLAGAPIVAVAPAGQHEMAGTRGTAEQLDRGIPEGTRFSLDMTQRDILDWLDARSVGLYPLRDTLRTILTAMAEYGWFVGDTSPHSASWIFASAANPATRDGWKRCGIPEGAASKSLLAGLPMDRLRVWAPPKQLVDGRWTTGHGWATDARYPA